MKLSIPEPCNENWNEMTTTQKGKFCGSCQKDVIDFSKMNKTEIKNYFIQQVGKSTCGRFEARQLTEFNRPEIGTRKLNSKPWWIAAAALFVFAKPGLSQGTPALDKKTKTEINKSPVAMEAPRKDKIDPGDLINKDSLVAISGQILNENGDTLPFVTIKIKDTKIGCVTDFYGKFKLIVPLEFQDSLILQISYVGYMQIEKSLVLNYKSKDIGAIKFKELQLYIDGVVMQFGGIVAEKPTFKVKARNVLLRMFR
jgi:hypothetical protein